MRTCHRELTRLWNFITTEELRNKIMLGIQHQKRYVQPSVCRYTGISFFHLHILFKDYIKYSLQLFIFFLRLVNHIKSKSNYHTATNYISEGNRKKVLSKKITYSQLVAYLLGCIAIKLTCFVDIFAV